MEESMPIKKVPIIDINPKQFNTKTGRPPKRTFTVYREVQLSGFYIQEIEAESKEEAFRIAERNPRKGASRIHMDEDEYRLLRLKLDDIDEV